MTGREPAWRVFAQELAASTGQERGTGEFAATYVRSPLGARMNRVLLVGVLSLSSTSPVDRSAPFLRALLRDPTGNVSVTAGGFQPRALKQLQTLSQPAPVLLVGKVHLFLSSDGVPHPSVRAEAFRPVSEREHRAGLADALRHTFARLDLIDRFASSGYPSDSGPAPETIPPLWVEAARSILGRSSGFDRAGFRRTLQQVSESLRTHKGTGTIGSAPALAEPVTVRRAPPVAAGPPPSAAERSLESAFLDIVDRLCEGSLDGYADLKELLGQVAERAIPEAKAEELLNRLEKSGVLEEPIVGRFRRA